MNLIQKEKKKHQDLIEKGNSQINKNYSRYAMYAMTDLQKEIQKAFAEKYK